MTCLVTTDISLAARSIRAGDVVGVPTETVYGLAGNALDPVAIAKIFAAKDRPFFDPLIVHVGSMEQAAGLTMDWPDAAIVLAERFWPGPLTLVLPKRAIVPELVTAGLPHVAIRFPSHPVMRQLIDECGCPLAAPSANLFGRLSPTTSEHVVAQLGDRIGMVLEGGPSQVGVESTIVAFDGDRLMVLRHGGIPTEALSMGGRFHVLTPSGIASENAPQQAPGQLAQHYAPRTPIVLNKKLPAVVPPQAGCLMMGQDLAAGFQVVENISPSADLAEAATNFFPALHRLDAAGLDIIFAIPFPDVGLGRALNDRLQRASAAGRPSLKRQ